MGVARFGSGETGFPTVFLIAEAAGLDKERRTKSGLSVAFGPGGAAGGDVPTLALVRSRVATRRAFPYTV
jgi:hypothetical protein